MPDLYSQLLAVAGVAAAGALLAGGAARLGMRRALLVQWVPLLAGVSILVLVVASVSHLFVAHGHDSAEPLEPMAFLGEHPALAVIAFLALLALGVGRDRRRR